MKKIVAIVQARMGSNRLPCKSLLDLRGFPVIDWVTQRIKRSKSLDSFIVAVPDTPLDKALQNHLTHTGAPWFAGSENDVLYRFAQAIQATGATHVVRICADNPLVSPEAIDQLTDFYDDSNADYVWNHIPRQNLWPDGLGAEMVSSELLLHLQEVVTDPAQREHCFNYLWDNQGQFKFATFNPTEKYLQRPDIKLDLDTTEDYSRLAQLPLEPSADLWHIIAAWDGVNGTKSVQSPRGDCTS